ncbi:MarC family protein [Candidatus Protochlamydia phocaeensis]|uniref:MarC family protein n=1 Tax=Candidatus Protochlamydia phocaeensis TaxID=1414722 RepID=UPI000837E614|nr:MarC family protein [Candidatus Protochlamydia phocaeensis]
MSLFNIALALFLIMDPVGNISSYHTLVGGLDSKRQNWIIFREMLIALLVMIGFNYLGEYIFDFLDLSETTVRISSGLILFLIAIKILFTASDSPRANLPKGEPFIFPLAVPLIAGPGLMATIMLYAHLEPYQSIMLSAILIAWLLSVIILFFSNTIKRVLGSNGLMACERLIGMVLVLISVQRLLEGILLFWATQPQPM